MKTEVTEAQKKKRKIKWKTWLPIFIMGLPGFLYFFMNGQIEY